MKKDNKLTTSHGDAYASPSVAVTSLESQGRILDGSQGSTQNYNDPLPIWALGSDNEE